MLTKIKSASVLGIDSILIDIEVNVGRGVGFNLVGLPDNTVRESYHRITAAFQNNYYKWPGKKITINMAPADLKKEGAAFDLPIAIGILAASEQLDESNFDELVNHRRIGIGWLG